LFAAALFKTMANTPKQAIPYACVFLRLSSLM